MDILKRLLAEHFCAAISCTNALGGVAILMCCDVSLFPNDGVASLEVSVGPNYRFGSILGEAASHYVVDYCRLLGKSIQCCLLFRAVFVYCFAFSLV